MIMNDELMSLHLQLMLAGERERYTYAASRYASSFATDFDSGTGTFKNLVSLFMHSIFFTFDFNKLDFCVT